MKKISNQFLLLTPIQISLLFSTLAFQGCSPGSILAKFNNSEKSTQDSLNSGHSIGPISQSGSSISYVMASGGDRVVVAKEYRHKTHDRYFITARSEDQAAVEPGGALALQWESTGNTYSLYESQVAGSTPLCRFYIPATMTHFYTADSAECLQLRNDEPFKSSFNYEGFEHYAIKSVTCPSNTTQVFRVFSNSAALNQRRHRYTSSQATLSSLVASGWANEGLAFCTADTVVIAPPAPVSGGSAITCTDSQSFANLTALKSAVCSQSTCTQINGLVVACGGADKFGPCLQCSSSSYSPPVSTPPVVTPRNCTFNGVTVAHNATVIAYQQQSVASGSSCISDLRTCLNGVLSSGAPHGGSYTNSACVVLPAGTPPPPPPPPPVVVADPPTPVSCNVRYTFDFDNSRFLDSMGNINPSGGNFTYQRINGNSTFVIKLIVKPTDSTATYNLGASFVFTQDDTTTFSNRTVTFSKTCNDFSGEPAFTNSMGGSIPVKTADDLRTTSSSGSIFKTILTPGVWYINVRNDTCPDDTNCSISGIWRNWKK